MAVNRRDYAVIGVIVVVLLALAGGKLFDRARKLPDDLRHHHIYQDLKSGRDRAEIELLCMTCHSKSSIPLPERHPPKEQCLICHKAQV